MLRTMAEISFMALGLMTAPLTQRAPKLSFVVRLTSSSTHPTIGSRLIGRCNKLPHGRPTTRGAIFSHCDNNLPECSYSKQRNLARDALAILARRGRTWKRLVHLIDMVIDKRNDSLLTTPVRTVADVGCDHGILTLGLVALGRFDKVLGIDVSERALQDGAISLHQQMLDRVSEDCDENDSIPDLPVELRVGDGLSVVNYGEADAVFIAGVGSHKILKILQQTSSNDGPLDLDRIGCRHIILQPADSRPRDLIKLYAALEAMGWHLADERIEKLSSRWYVSSSFLNVQAMKKPPHVHHQLPGSRLMQLSESDPMSKVFDEYIGHHSSWIYNDAQSNGTISENEKMWLGHIGVTNY